MSDSISQKPSDGKGQQLKSHPITELFPAMSAMEFKSLVTDIRDHGLLAPIELHENQILDGRHRYWACLEVGIEPRLVDAPCNGDALAYVVSKNLHRRHLTSSQRAMVAAAALPFHREQAKKRQGERTDLEHGGKNATKFEEGGEARDHAAKAFGVSSRYVQDAAAIADADPELAAEVRAGRTKISSAMRRVKWQQARREAETRAVVADIPNAKIITGDFREAVIEDTSVDFIFTDLPYFQESVDATYADLAAFAERVLRPTGWLLAYVGVAFLPKSLAALSTRLAYGWTFSVQHTGGDPRYHALNLKNKWKPIVGFYKPPLNVYWQIFRDSVSGGEEKDRHPWPQSEVEAAHYIQHLCPEGGLVLDPFCGSGTTPAAALTLGRRCIGIDPGAAAMTRQRVAESEGISE